MLNIWLNIKLHRGEDVCYKREQNGELLQHVFQYPHWNWDGVKVCYTMCVSRPNCLISGQTAGQRGAAALKDATADWTNVSYRYKHSLAPEGGQTRGQKHSVVPWRLTDISILNTWQVVHWFVLIHFILYFHHLMTVVSWLLPSRMNFQPLFEQHLAEACAGYRWLHSAYLRISKKILFGKLVDLDFCHDPITC